jgi:16S rRNA (adenine1518-N6/adenine1519-N6)-dimethyltransferase
MDYRAVKVRAQEQIVGQRFGQHFLKDQSIIRDLIRAFDPSGPVIEIGPGKGALTYPLLDTHKPLWVIEIDSVLQEHWDQERGHHPQLQVIKGDVLAYDWMEWGRWSSEKFSIISNLPYEISGPFLVRLAQHHILWSKAVILLQQEIVQKVLSSPSHHNYGRLSVQVQRYCNVKAGRIVTPGAFQPPPKVMSQFLWLTPRNDIPSVPSEALWDDLLREAFCHRRQMMRRIFKRYPVDWEGIEIDPTARPENLGVDAWVRFTCAVYNRHAITDPLKGVTKPL